MRVRARVRAGYIDKRLDSGGERGQGSEIVEGWLEDEEVDVKAGGL